MGVGLSLGRKTSKGLVYDDGTVYGYWGTLETESGLNGVNYVVLEGFKTAHTLEEGVAKCKIIVVGKSHDFCLSAKLAGHGPRQPLLQRASP